MIYYDGVVFKSQYLITSHLIVYTKLLYPIAHYSTQYLLFIWHP